MPVIANCVPKLVAMATSLSIAVLPSSTIPWTHPSPQLKRHLDRFSRFCADDRRVSLYFTMGRPFPPQNCPFNDRIPGPTRIFNPNGISIGAAMFAGLTSVTDRQTDHATRSVAIDRIYVRSAAMRPNIGNATVICQD